MADAARKSDPSDFAQGSLTRIILHQAVPVMLAQIAQMLYNIVDRIYIGHMPGTGEAALSGVGLVFPIITIIAAFTNLYGTGGAPLFAIARGAGDDARAKKILGNTTALLIGTSFILMAVGYLFEKPVLILGYTPPENARELVYNDISQAVFSYDYAKALSDAVAPDGVRVNAHVKMDTGMSRLGFVYHDSVEDYPVFDEIERACRLPGIDVLVASQFRKVDPVNILMLLLTNPWTNGNIIPYHSIKLLELKSLCLNLRYGHTTTDIN